MNLLDIVKKDQKGNSKKVDYIISELKKLHEDIRRTAEYQELDDTISKAIGKLSAGGDAITDEQLIEILVVIGDKLKTKTQQLENNYLMAMDKIILAKIEFMRLYEENLTRTPMHIIFSAKTALTVTMMALVLLGALLAAHMVDRELFVDIGLSNNKTAQEHRR